MSDGNDYTVETAVSVVDLPSDGWTEVREIETMHGSRGHSEIRIDDLVAMGVQPRPRTLQHVRKQQCRIGRLDAPACVAEQCVQAGHQRAGNSSGWPLRAATLAAHMRMPSMVCCSWRGPPSPAIGAGRP